MEIPSNPVLDKLPAHLRQYIKPQDYEQYTAQDQAVWQYVMRKNVQFLKEHAHSSYTQGLSKTGITIDRIPSMYGMNRILQEIGWAAAAVDGLIPSAAFMEFQAYNVLVIASEIRHQDHIEYTPTPDIIHESAGHAPILANPEYAEFLRRIGNLGARAISSHLDEAIFKAVRHLSILKEEVDTPTHLIEEAEQKVSELQDQLGDLSEMTKMRNLHWWSVEYGLIGSVDDYKLYGAGLLSSIGESKWCMSDQVIKKPYTIEAAYQNFDVTKAQPQLFVTPSFAHLSQVLEELADSMAIRHGGKKGVEKLIDSDKLGTIELSTGLQISGHFKEVIPHHSNPNKVAYVQLEGPVALSNRDKELIGHGVDVHPHGYGTPIGKLKGIRLAIEDMAPRDLRAYNIYEEEEIELIFESEVVVKGRVISGTRNLAGKIQVIAFSDCLVTYKDRVLFEPSWGIYHMAVGKKIISAYSGPADDNSFEFTPHQITDYKVIAEPSDVELCYQRLEAEIRDKTELEAEWDAIMNLKESNWLLTLKFYEKSLKAHPELAEAAVQKLEKISNEKPNIRHLIEDGLDFLKSNIESLKVS